MKLEDARTAYENLSAKASDIVRQISLAGVGLIWIFKSNTGSSVAVEPTLLKAALFIFLALAFDFFQYLLGTTTWFIYFRLKESKGITQADEFQASPKLNWPTWALFYLKSAMMLIAYCFYILPFLAGKFRG